jgi:hypothetical protein
MKNTLVLNGTPLRVVESEERGFFFFAVEERHIPED